MSEQRTSILRRLREMERGPKAPDPARRDLKARTAILDATLKLLLLDGWREVTIEGVAAEAGVGKQTIYRWWPSKGVLVIDAVLGDGSDTPAVPDTGDFAADLRSMVAAMAEELSEPSFDSIMRGLIVEAQNDATLARAIETELVQPLTAATKKRIEAAREAGQVDTSIDPSILVELIYGPLVRRWLLGTGELDQEFADAVAEMVLRAVSSRGRGR